MIENVLLFKEEMPVISRPHHLFPIRYKRSGVHVYDRERVMPGITLLTTYWPETEWTAGIRLLDIDGNTLHHWEIKANEIWPESPFQDIASGTKNKKRNYVHGTYLFPNGDIVFSIEYLGLFRMNSRGEIIWKLKYRTHHSVYRDKEGNFWVPGLKWIDKNDRRFPYLQPPFADETVLKVTPDGVIINEISLLESVYRSPYKYLFIHYPVVTGEIFHLNDIEVLEDHLAAKFPVFDPGDLVISSNFMHFIAVMNQSGHIKWVCPGIFTYQHDPDFEEDGSLVVFDNRRGLGLSKIIALNPVTGFNKTIYPTQKDQWFFTAAGGKHQKLANGNRLITESRTGRVFEITKEGETVWEWINQPYNDRFVPEVLEGTRYYLSKEEVAKWPRR